MIRLNRYILDSIAEQFGETFYLLDPLQFKHNYSELLDSFRSYYPETYIAYSYKTNYIPRLCKIIDELGGYAEITSDMEYELAKRIGVSPERMILNGPCKTIQTMEELLTTGGTVNLDSAAEFPLIRKIAASHPDRLLRIGVRCNFDVGDGLISRFGFDIESKEFLEAVCLGREYPNIQIAGLHCHYSSHSLETWRERTEHMAELAGKKLGIWCQRVDLGGGMYSKMEDSLKAQYDVPISEYIEYGQLVGSVMNKYFKNEKRPALFVEPGSALVADVMMFAAKVSGIKTVRKKAFASLLGSRFNINPTMSCKNLPMEIYHEQGEEGEWYDELDFGGYTCMEGDIMYRGYSGNLSVGDYAVFKNAGSYSIVLKPPFILPNFPVVEFDEEKGSMKLVKRKETFDDVFQTYLF